MSLNTVSPLRDPAAFAALFDHTLLRPEANTAEIRRLCHEAREFGFRGVCVNPCYVALAARELAGSPQVAMAVVGFPLGANRTDVKIDETLRAVADGAQEIDMVLSIGLYLSGEVTAVRHDIASVVRAAGSAAAVKVILETGYLTRTQTIELCEWCVAAGAAFVKTSTGFGPRGASVEDVRAMAEGVHGRAGIKASGGIRSLASATALVEAGATRLGSSSSVQILSDFRRKAAEG